MSVVKHDHPTRFRFMSEETIAADDVMNDISAPACGIGMINY